MLKFLRKYSQWILVIGGTLLMIAFLLPTTISELGKQPLFTTVMKIDGDRIGQAEYQLAAQEYSALDFLTFQMLPQVSNVTNTDHWLLLVREAELAGYVAGKGEGAEFLPDLVRQILFASGRAYTTPAEQLEELTKQFVTIMEQGMPSVQSRTGLSQDQIYTALSKLHGVIRMQVAYQRAARYSDRRLALGMKQQQDRTEIEYVFVPAEQVMTEAPEPTEDQIVAHFEKYKEVDAGAGDLGIGYKLPERVKLEWLTLDRAAIAAAVVPDPVEVHKRFLKANPSGAAPEGQTLEQAKAPYETEVRGETIERAMRAADQVIRGEFERALRRTEISASYRKLPADWDQVRPDLVRVRDAVVARVKEQVGIDIPGPTVNRRAADWVTQKDVQAIEGIGRAFLQRGSLREPFSTVLFQVRELAGDNEYALQVGVPGESVTDFAGNRYYYIVTDARKPSAPDSLDEARAKVVTDLKRLAAFEKLRTQLDAFRQRAIDEGFAELVVAEGSAIEPAKKATVISTGVYPADANINDENFRKAILKLATGINPSVNVAEIPAADRTVAMELPRAFGLGIAMITGVMPVTDDAWRRNQASAVANLTRVELQVEDFSDNPFTLEQLEKRHKVDYKVKRVKSNDAD